MAYALGIDFGTSGARAIVVDAAVNTVAATRVSYPADAPQDWPQTWLKALDSILSQISRAVRQQITAIALDGTSGTVLLCDEQGVPVTAPLLYNDDRGRDYVAAASAIAPPDSPACGATSSLVKLLWWRATLSAERLHQARYVMHQADWLAFHLHGQPNLSDYHNALKLGYDVGLLAYPEAIAQADIAPWLPQVVPPGTSLGAIQPQIATRYCLPAHCQVKAGTTDSIAAFLASGERSLGTAVTSLGSTLALKLLSATRVDDRRYGVYSHRLGDCWLAGGASNTGGAVLKQFFTETQLISLSQQIDPAVPSELDYYPLTQPGERFPVSDPNFQPRLTPRPDNDITFLKGILEGMARIEAAGYQKLQALGASSPRQILTAGGGANNLAWMQIRQRYFSAPVKPAPATEAALGAARLAQAGLAGWTT